MRYGRLIEINKKHMFFFLGGNAKQVGLTSAFY